MSESFIGYLTDIHLTKRIPRFRNLANFFEYQIEQLTKALNFYKANNIQLVLLGGDLFDVYTEFNTEELETVSSLLRSYDITFVSCYGNHDLKGNSVELEMLRKTSAYWVASNTPNLYMLVDDSIKVEGLDIKVVSWKTPTYDLIMSGSYDTKHDIILLHAPITAEPSEHTTGVRDLKVYNTKLILLGDQHTGVPRIKHKGCVYYSPGAFSKLTHPEKTIDVVVPIIQLTDTRVSIYDHTLPNESSTWKTKQDKLDITIDSEVIHDLRKLTGTQEKYDLDHLVRKAGNELKISDRVVKEVLSKINE